MDECDAGSPGSGRASPYLHRGLLRQPVSVVHFRFSKAGLLVPECLDRVEGCSFVGGV
jgi:hypothetical protein